MKKIFMNAKNKMTGIKNEMMVIGTRAKTVMADNKGENYVDTAVKILIAIVIGALLLAGLYALFGDVVMPTLTERIRDMFDYAG